MPAGVQRGVLLQSEALHVFMPVTSPLCLNRLHYLNALSEQGEGFRFGYVHVTRHATCGHETSSPCPQVSHPEPVERHHGHQRTGVHIIMKGLLRQHLLQTFGFWIPDWVCEVLDWLCEFRIGFARFWIASSLVTSDWVCEVLDWLCELCGDVGEVAR